MMRMMTFFNVNDDMITNSSHAIGHTTNDVPKRTDRLRNNYPKNDILQYSKIGPGSNSYAEKTVSGNKVCIIGDSIAQRINTRLFNNELKSTSEF